MEIEDSFCSLDEIADLLSAGGFSFRTGFDDDFDDMGDDFEDKNEMFRTGLNKNTADTQLSAAQFSVELSPEEIQRLELELPEPDSEKNDEEEENEENEWNENSDEKYLENFEKFNASSFQKELEAAEIVYFDLFKSKRYVKTLIFQKEEKAYYLIGFCEAPMCRVKN
ncbi:hypothetical protein [Methanolapillus ohkumae]|uniref:Uncharacterized protein n=1 Tax=Methanolapillus ohkumae TaxID=3028298 RepID=A0AA96V7V8_9EURY|nr:hypothetical protein MsAm2_12420 [Methanosarcinaceae archaeon Am2]